MTESAPQSPTALAGLRVLELGAMVAAPFCGKLLASLGADVIKIEPPKMSDPSRRRGPCSRRQSPPGTQRDVPVPEHRQARRHAGR